MLTEANHEGPLHFVNLLSFHEAAPYPEDHEMAESSLTGTEASNNHYGPVAHRHVTQPGGQLRVLARVEQYLVGTGANWHQIATMEYPNTDAFMDMIVDPDYRASLVHRDAGLADSVLLVTCPLIDPDST